MDNTAILMLEAFHVPANKGSLHPNDQERLYNFIHYVAKQDWDLDEVIGETYRYLTRTDQKPWREETARELMRTVRTGVEVLRYTPDFSYPGN